MACFCTGKCREIGYCPNDVGDSPPWRRTSLEPLRIGRTHREPLTEKQIREIVREELDRAKEKA